MGCLMFLRLKPSPAADRLTDSAAVKLLLELSAVVYCLASEVPELGFGCSQLPE